MKILRRAIPVALGVSALVPLSVSTAEAQTAPPEMIPPETSPSACSVSNYLTKGVRGSDEVRCIQQTLNGVGVDSGPVDGYFGPITRAAIVAYQQANNLIVDGEVGNQTAGALGIWADPQPPAPAPSPKPAATKRTTAKAAPKAKAAKSGGGSVTFGSEGGSTVWDALAQCESGGNWHIATGNGYYGGLQFTASTWRSMGGSGMPHEASREEQIAVAERTLRSGGWGQWPACSRKLGLR